MVVEAWLLKMGNQVSNNPKNSHLRRQIKDLSSKTAKENIGILSFEVANVMSKLIQLHKSVSYQEISRLKNEIIKSEGVKKLVSCDESCMLKLAYAEKLDDLTKIAEVISRLGRKCNEPALQGFEHVFGDVICGKIEIKEQGFLVKDMEGVIRKMEKYAIATANLHTEMEALNEFERTRRKIHLKKNVESEHAYEQKLLWQRKVVKQLKETSLWNQTYDKVVELLARTICTVYARICTVFRNDNSVLSGERSEKKAPNLRTQWSLPRGPSHGRILMQCLSLGSSVSRIDDDYNLDEDFSLTDHNSHDKKRDHFLSNSGSFLGKLAIHATPSTTGGSALALHYANVIIAIEKLLCCPQLVGKEARHNLYQMLPVNLRESVRKNLRSQSKIAAVCDARSAHNWKETLDGIIKWLSPLVHNTIRWQSERNFEKQQQIGARTTSVLLLQTLYFADRDKTEAVICELLVGLNYICRYEQEQRAILQCTNSFGLGEWKGWQLQGEASRLDR